MKVKELIFWLRKLNPEQEVMCCGDGCDLYSNIIITDKSCIGEVWIIGADDKVTQNIDIQLGEKYEETFSIDEALAIAKAESSDAWRACVYISLVCDGTFPDPDDRTIRHMCKRFMHDRARIAKSGCKRLWSVLEKVRRAFAWRAS